MDKKILELNLEKNYVIYEDSPKEKIPIAEGKVILNLNESSLIMSFKEIT